MGNKALGRVHPRGNCPTGLLQWVRIPGLALQTAARQALPVALSAWGLGTMVAEQGGKAGVPGPPYPVACGQDVRVRNEAPGAAVAQG